MEELKKYRFLNRLKYIPWVESVWIFGSRARGDNRERSDIDVAVVCKPGTTDEEWSDVVNVVETKDTGLKVDLIRLDTLKDGEFKNRIMRDRKEWILN